MTYQIDEESNWFGAESPSLSEENTVSLESSNGEPAKPISIISDDCWAGQFYQLFNLPYLSPTIGLSIESKTYLDFLNHLRNPDAFDLKFIQSAQTYPVAVTPYATLHFHNYHTEDQARNAFLRRVERIDWFQLFIKIDLGKAGYSEKEVEQWNVLNLPNAIALYPPNKFGLRPQIHHGVMIPDWTLDRFKMFNISRQHFDLSHWMNTGEIKLLDSLKPAIAHGEAFLSDASETPATYLQRAVEQLPEGELVSIQSNGSSVTCTYSQLWRRAASISGGLRCQGFKPGQPLILLLEHCQDFVATLWGCLMGGFVPVSIRVAADSSQPSQPWLKLATALELLDEAAILTTHEIGSSLTQQPPQKQHCQIIYLEELEVTSPDYTLHLSQVDDLAALYFSSGTTGKPKLVSFRSQAVLNRLLTNHCDGSDAKFLYWLPLDHASANLRIITPDVQQKVYLPTELFIKSPLTWLNTVEKYQITHANMTNFGMALTTQSVDRYPNLHWDLTSIHVIGIGAEAIVPKTYQTFLSKLAPFGLNPEAMCVGYGLTECGTAVGSNTGTLLNDQVQNHQFLALGKPCQGYSIRITDKQNFILHEGEIGYVQIKGPATTTGYYGNTKETDSLFIEDGWVHTGDLGYLYNQSLTITGRDKDIIIINAKNYSCQQIEQIVEAIAGVEVTFTVACAVRTSSSTTDELAIFFHTACSDLDLVPLRKQIQVAIVTQLGITPTYLIPLAKAAFPRTEMGKIQRAELFKQLVNGEFVSLLNHLNQLTEAERQKTFAGSQTKTEAVITAIWSDILKTQSISLHDNFFELGGNSLLAVQVVAAIEQELGVNLPLATFLQAATVHELATVIDQTGWINLWQPLVPIQTTGDRPNLFCIHGGGCHVLIYRNLALQMGTDQPVYGLQARESDAISSASVNIEAIATDYIYAIKTVQPDGPYFLAGLSFGGKIAIEMARQLQQQGQEVAFVALFDSYAAEGLYLLPPLHQLLSIVYYLFRYRIPQHLRTLLETRLKKKRVPFQQAAVTKESRKADLLSSSTNQEQKNIPSVQIFYPKESSIQQLIHKFNLATLKHSPWSFLYEKVKSGQFKRLSESNSQKNNSNQALKPSYDFEVYNGCIMLFCAAERPPGLKTAPMLGWDRVTKGTINVFKIPGHHTSMMDSPLLAKILRQCMDDTQIECTK